MKVTALLIITTLLAGCATKHGVAVYGWKSNVAISVQGDATQEALIEATTDAKASVTP
jgi:hypothetical protein